MIRNILAAALVGCLSGLAAAELAAAELAAAELAAAELAAGAGPRVDIVLGEPSPQLERRAAEELGSYLQRLYDANVRVTSAVPDEGAHAIFIGSPRTNAQSQPFTDRWPRLSDQGHVLRTVTFRGRPALLAGGETPVATYWAVAELAHRWGIRSLLYGDVFPVEPPAFGLDGYDVVIEPQLRSRAWRTINDFAIGPESWGLEEQQRVLRQLAKLKYNRIVLAVYPWQPFVHFELDGVAKRTGVLWYGWPYSVSGDTAGRSVFHGAKQFENPDFAGRSTYEERVAAGQKLIRGIIDTAHELGMTTGLAMSPLEFPREFGSLLPGARPIQAPVELAIGPGPQQGPGDPQLLRLATAQLRAYLDTYPGLDAIYLSLSEFPAWGEHAESSWRELAGRPGGSTLPSLEQLVATARNRSLTASRERGEQAVRGNLVALDFFRRLRADQDLQRRADAPAREVHFVALDPALFPHLERVLPPDTKALHFIDYTARRVSQQPELLASVPADKVDSSLILTLADDNVGVLPQAAHGALAQLLGELQRRNWTGFSTRFWCIGDLDLSAYLLSRASCGAALTPQQACHDLVTPICGAGVSDRVLQAFELVEHATNLVDQHDLGFGFPVPNVVMKHYASDEPPPAWWSEVRDDYLNAMNEMYRANTRARDGGRSYTLYFARRFEFGFEYMNTVEAVRKAGIARRKGDADTQLAELEKAAESMNAALTALAAVARSNSDRGIIAVLNEYGYRPLVKQLEEPPSVGSK